MASLLHLQISEPGVFKPLLFIIMLHCFGMENKKLCCSILRNFHWIEVLGERSISPKLARALLREFPPTAFLSLIELFTNLLSGRCFAEELALSPIARAYLNTKEAHRLAHFTQPSRSQPSIEARKEFFSSAAGIDAIAILLPVILSGCRKTGKGKSGFSYMF